MRRADVGPAPAADGRLLDLIAGLRLDEAGALEVVSREADRRRLASDLAAAPAGVTFTLVELTPMILRGDGSLSYVSEGDGVNTLVDGDLVLLPYEFAYADATTTLAGQFSMRWAWSTAVYGFVAAEPPFQFVFAGPETGVTIAGTVYNSFLDMIEGDAFDNGQIVGARVTFIDTVSGEVFVTETDAQGTFVSEVLQGDRVWQLRVEGAGYYQTQVTVVAPATGAVEGIRLSLMMMPDELGRTSVIHGIVRDLDGANVGGIIARAIDATTGEDLDLPAAQTNVHGEYVIPGVPVWTGNALSVRVERNGRVSDAPIVVPDPAQPPAWIRTDVVFENHAPTIACLAEDGSALELVALSALPGDLLTLSVRGEDADGDAVTYAWQAAEGTVQAGPGGTATYAVPMMAGVWRVYAMPVDETFAIGSACRFEITTE